jgi:hypothetical protein
MEIRSPDIPTCVKTHPGTHCESWTASATRSPSCPRISRPPPSRLLDLICSG